MDSLFRVNRIIFAATFAPFGQYATFSCLIENIIFFALAAIFTRCKTIYDVRILTSELANAIGPYGLFVTLLKASGTHEIEFVVIVTGDTMFRVAINFLLSFVQISLTFAGCTKFFIGDFVLENLIKIFYPSIPRASSTRRILEIRNYVKIIRSRCLIIFIRTPFVRSWNSFVKLEIVVVRIVVVF